VKYLAQVVGIVANNFSENTPSACSIVQFNNFFNVFQLLNSFVVLRTLLQVEPQKSTNVIPQLLRINLKVGAFNHSHLFELFHTTMDSSARNDQIFSYLR